MVSDGGPRTRCRHTRARQGGALGTGARALVGGGVLLGGKGLAATAVDGVVLLPAIVHVEVALDPLEHLEVVEGLGLAELGHLDVLHARCQLWEEEWGCWARVRGAPW